MKKFSKIFEIDKGTRQRFWLKMVMGTEIPIIRWRFQWPLDVRTLVKAVGSGFKWWKRFYHLKELILANGYSSS